MAFTNLSYFVKKLVIPNIGDTSPAGIAIAETVNQYINKYEPKFFEKLFGYPLYKAFLEWLPKKDEKVPVTYSRPALYLIADELGGLISGGLSYENESLKDWILVLHSPGYGIMIPDKDYKVLDNGGFELLDTNAAIVPEQRFVITFEPIIKDELPKDDRFIDLIYGKEYTDLNGNLKYWKGLIEKVFEETQSAPAQYESVIANFIYWHYRKDNHTQYTGIGEVGFYGENTNAASPRKRMVSVWNEMAERANQCIDFLVSNETVYPEFTFNDRLDAFKYFGPLNPYY
jgi:hypothetical protein